MPDWRGAATGTISGAASGFSVAGPPGAIIGGLAGLLSGIFGSSASDIYEERIQKLLQHIAEARSKAIAEGHLIAQQAQASVQTARAGAGRYAAAHGVKDVTPYTQAAGEREQAAGSAALSSYLEKTNQAYDQMALQAEGMATGGPIPEPASSVVAKIGQSAVGFVQDIRRQKLIDEYNRMNPPGASSPGVTGPGDFSSPLFENELTASRTAALNSFKSNVGPGVAVPGFDDKQVDAATKDLLAAYRRMNMGLGPDRGN